MAKGSVETDLVFTGDLLMVDYLSTLLASSPQLSAEFSPTYFNSRSDVTGRPTLVGSPAVDNTSRFKTEIAVMEAESLRSENENLKFKTELAKIDSEVLRDENDKLKYEVDRLKSELSSTKKRMSLKLVETQKRLNSELSEARSRISQFSVENDELKAQLEPLRSQVSILTEILAEKMHEASQPVAVEEAVVAQGIEVEIEGAREAAVALQLVSDTEKSLPGQPETPQISLAERQVFATTFNSAAEEGRPKQHLQIVSSGVAAQKREIRKTVFAQERTVVNSSAAHGGTVSKIVKIIDKSPDLQPVNKLDYQQPRNQDVRPEAPVVPKPVLAQPPLPVEPELQDQQQGMQEDAVINDARKALDTDEIKLDAVPVSKTVKRINAKNYELLQQEADGKQPAPGQNVAFVT